MKPEQKIKNLIRKEIDKDKEQMEALGKTIVSRLSTGNIYPENPYDQSSLTNMVRSNIISVRYLGNRINILESILNWDVLNTKPKKRK